MATTSVRPGPAATRRRRGRIWALLAGGIVLNGLRLRARLARLPVLPDDSAVPDDQPDDQTGIAFVTAAGIHVDAATRRSVARFMATEGLEVVDLVPGDLPVEQVLELARLVETATYRTDRLALGRGPGQAVAATAAVLDRAGLARTAGLDEVEMLQATVRLKQCAPAATDLAIAPSLAAVAERPGHRVAYLRGIAGRSAPGVAAIPLAQYGLMALGLVASPGWGAAALAASALQPWLATAGTALRPADRTPGLAATRWARLPWRAARALRSEWEPAVEVAADPRRFARLRPVYDDLLAQGTDGFFEARRHDCPMCGCGDLEARVVVGDLLQHKPGTFRLEGCPGCGHVFQNPRLTVAGLDFYYRDFYDGLAADEAEFLFAATDAAYRDRARLVARTTATADATPARWLDVGGGHGHFCLIAAEELPDTRFDGLDMSESIDEAARRGWVTEGHRGLFPDLAPGLAGTYDVVSMHHYLEHTREPLAELDAARTVLQPGGHLLIELPDPECGFGRIMGPLWGPWFQPQHQHFLPITNLCAALEARGFTVVARERGEAHQPADLSYFLWLLAQRIAPKPAKPWLPDPTPGQRIGRVATFAAFGPAFVAALLADAASAPLLRALPNGSNAYRVLARLDR